MREQSDKVIGLIQSDKIGVVGGIPIFTLEELDVLITGKEADPEMIDIMKRKNIAVYQV